MLNAACRLSAPFNQSNDLLVPKFPDAAKERWSCRDSEMHAERKAMWFTERMSAMCGGVVKLIPLLIASGVLLWEPVTALEASVLATPDAGGS